MTAAVFALAGTLLGMLGALGTQVIQARNEEVRARRDAVRFACTEFISAVARVRNLAIELKNHPMDSGRLESMRDANRQARECFERLRLIASSVDVQKAGRHVARYTYGLLRQAEGKPPRPDEQNPELMVVLNDWLVKLRAEVRREIRIPNPNNQYRDPEEWINPPD